MSLKRLLGIALLGESDRKKITLVHFGIWDETAHSFWLTEGDLSEQFFA